MKKIAFLIVNLWAAIAHGAQAHKEIKIFHDYCILMGLDSFQAVRLTTESTELTTCSSDNKRYAEQILKMLCESKEIQAFQANALAALRLSPNDPNLRPWNDAAYARQLLLIAKLHMGQSQIQKKSGRKK